MYFRAPSVSFCCCPISHLTIGQAQVALAAERFSYIPNRYQTLLTSSEKVSLDEAVHERFAFASVQKVKRESGIANYQCRSYDASRTRGSEYLFSATGSSYPKDSVSGKIGLQGLDLSRLPGAHLVNLQILVLWQGYRSTPTLFKLKSGSLWRDALVTQFFVPSDPLSELQRKTRHLKDFRQLSVASSLPND